MSQNVNVNLVPGNYPKEFHVSQYDVGRQLVANIVDSTGAYSIPSGATVTLVGTKPSGFGFTLSGTVGSGGVVTFSTTATVTAEYGRIPCEIRIESGNTVLGTANCMLIVEMSPHPEGTTDGDGEVIVNQITLLLERITQQADRAVAASEAAQASEIAAAASEANAASSESNAAASEATALSAKDDAVAAKTAAQASEQAAAESAAEARETLETYAKVDGEYDGMTVGTAKQLLSDSTTTDTEPYIYRQTAGGGDREEVEEVVGGTVAWNQLVNGASVTVPNGHKYYMIKGGTASIGASTGTAITGLTSGTDIVTDLTAMFGTQIADAIYAMEQSQAGDGVAWFKALFPKSYYPYNAGELMSVKTSAHVMKDADENIIGNYPLSPIDLRGIPKWVDGRLKFDGDVYEADGTVTRRYGLVDLSSLTWAKDSDLDGYHRFYATANLIKASDYRGKIISTIPTAQNYTVFETTEHIMITGYHISGGYLYIISDSISSVSDLMTYLTNNNGEAVYELATPTTEATDPYTVIQVCDPNGTEEWTDERTVQIPVGNVTKYHANLKEKLEDLPTIPSAPSANGTYTLKATVSDGAVTYQWVNG